MNRYIQNAILERPFVIATNKSGKTMDCSGIPDIWHIAMSLPEEEQEAVLDVWTKAHYMRDELQRIQSSMRNGDQS